MFDPDAKENNLASMFGYVVDKNGKVQMAKRDKKVFLWVDRNEVSRL